MNFLSLLGFPDPDIIDEDENVVITEQSATTSIAEQKKRISADEETAAESIIDESDFTSPEWWLSYLAIAGKTLKETSWELLSFAATSMQEHPILTCLLLAAYAPKNSFFKNIFASAQDPHSLPIVPDLLYGHLLSNIKPSFGSYDLSSKGDIDYIAQSYGGIYAFNNSDPLNITIPYQTTPGGNVIAVSPNFANNKIYASYNNGANVAGIVFNLPTLAVSSTFGSLTPSGNYGYSVFHNPATNYTYVGKAFSGLDVYNPSLTLANSYLTADTIYAFAYCNKILYGAAFNAGVYAWNATNPASPVVLDNYPTTSPALGVLCIPGTPYVQVSAFDAGILTFKFNNTFTLVSTFDTPGNAYSITPADNNGICHISDYASGDTIANCSDVTNMKPLGSLDTPYFTNKIMVKDPKPIPEFGFDPTTDPLSKQLAIADQAGGYRTAITGTTPTLTTNKLEITQGETVTLTNEHFSGAFSGFNNPSDQMYVFYNIAHGTLVDKSNTTANVTSFSQQALNEGRIAFQHDNSTLPPSLDVSVANAFVQSVSASTDITFHLLQPSQPGNHASDNTPLIVGIALVSTCFGVVCLGTGAAGIYAIHNKRKENAQKKELQLELSEYYEKAAASTLDSHTTEALIANRYQILQDEVGSGSYGHVYKGIDHKAPENSPFKHPAVKQILKNKKDFAQKLEEAKKQRDLVGINLELLSEEGAYKILSSSFIKADAKKQLLSLKPNCFYLAPISEKGHKFALAYLNPIGDIQIKPISTDSSLKLVYHHLNNFSFDQLKEVLNPSSSNIDIKESHYKKNQLARLITGAIPFEEIVNTDKHLMPVLDYLVQGETLYIYTILASLNGDAVRMLLADPSLDPQLKLQWLLLITDALITAIEYLHEQEVIHHDIKPSNLVFYDGKPLTIDFGESVKLSKDTEALRKSYLKGDCAFCAPETLPANRKTNPLINKQLTNPEEAREFLKKKDWFAVGATLAAFYTGNEIPFAMDGEENPQADEEKGKTYYRLKHEGTVQHFNQKINTALKCDSKNPLASWLDIVKKLSATDVTQRIDGKEARKLLEKNYGVVLEKAKTNRASLFQRLRAEAKTPVVKIPIASEKRELAPRSTASSGFYSTPAPENYQRTSELNHSFFNNSSLNLPVESVRATERSYMYNTEDNNDNYNNDNPMYFGK